MKARVWVTSLTLTAAVMTSRGLKSLSAREVEVAGWWRTLGGWGARGLGAQTDLENGYARRSPKVIMLRSWTALQQGGLRRIVRAGRALTVTVPDRNFGHSGRRVCKRTLRPSASAAPPLPRRCIGDPIEMRGGRRLVGGCRR